MLLLVVKTQDDQLRDVWPLTFRKPVDKSDHRLVDRLAVSVDLRDSRSRQDAALRPVPPLPERLVIRVEKEGVLRMIRLVPSLVAHKEHRFKEPGGVCK